VREGGHVGERLRKDLLGDDDVEAAGVGSEHGKHGFDGDVLDDYSCVPLGRSLHGREPQLARADGGYLRAPLPGESEGPLDCERLGVLGDRADERDVGAAGEPHTGDAPREIELGLYAFERRLAGRGDENGVGLAACRPRRRRKRVAETADGVAPERHVRLVHGESVQAGDGLHRAAGLGHQLGADAVAGEAGDFVATGSHGTAASRSKTS
jgi:hypothetical protein